MADVTIYTTKTCPHCATAKHHLEQMGIFYTERKVDVDHSAQREMQAMGVMGVPTLKVNGQVMVGFNAQQLAEMLKKKLVNCPMCHQKLRLPADKGILKVTCSKCSHQFNA